MQIDLEVTLSPLCMVMKMEIGVPYISFTNHTPKMVILS